MTLYLHDFIFILICVILGAAAYFHKNKKFRIGVAVLASVLFLFNPFRFVQPSGEVLERSVSRFDHIPEKEEVRRPTYDQRQAAEHEQLKKQSKEIRNEI